MNICVCKEKNRRKKWGRDDHRRIKENVKETVADRNSRRCDMVFLFHGFHGSQVAKQGLCNDAVASKGWKDLEKVK